MARHSFTNPSHILENFARGSEYIEIFYNRQRLQAKLGFLSPVAYARKYYAGLVAA